MIEDESLLAMLIEDMLLDLGYETAGVAMRLEAALDLARSIEADVAILDVNLGGKTSFPVADVLRERGIPFVFASGYGSKGLSDGYERELTLKKPFQSEELDAMLRTALTTAGAPGA